MLKRVGSIVLTVAMLLTMFCNVVVASAAGGKPQLALSVLGEAETNGIIEAERGEDITLLVSLENYVSAVAIEVTGSQAADAPVTLKEISGSDEEGNDYVDGTSVYFEKNVAAKSAIWTSLDDVPFPDVKEFCAVTYHVDENAKEGEYAIQFGISKYALYEDYLTDLGFDARLTVKIGHNFGNHKVQKPDGSPAKEEAQHKQYCMDCNDDIYTKCDFEVKEVVPPTCTKEGYTQFTCKICGYEVNGEFVGKEDHDFSEWEKNTPETGKHTRTCKNGCGTSETESCDYVSHTPANCTDAEKKICRHCGGTTTGEAATDHSWSAWENIPGTKTHKRICNNPNCPVVEETADCDIKLDTNISASCTSGGKKVYKCADNCGYERIEKSGALGHNYVADASGKTHSCTRCDDLKNVACTFSKTIQSGNCVKDTIQDCICGNRKVTKATGVHPESKKVIQYKAPSAKAAGYIQLICKDCNTKLNYAKNATLAKGKPFNDITSDVWFYDQAVFAKSFGMILGDDLGNFNGNNNLTRGQTVTILGRYIWGNLDQMSEKEFNALIKTLGTPTKLKDLKGSYYDRYAIALSTIGVVMGSDGYFNGDDNVTREQLAAFFIRYIDYIAPGTNATYGDANSLSDMNTVSPWFKDVAARAVKSGLIGGMDGKFNPKGNATRAQMATIMERVVRAHSQYPIVNV